MDKRVDYVVIGKNIAGVVIAKGNSPTLNLLHLVSDMICFIPKILPVTHIWLCPKFTLLAVSQLGYMIGMCCTCGMLLQG